MAGRRKAPLWRQVFLRALARGGNVRAAAFEAGVDPGTAYDHRAKDARFAGKWAAALGKAKNRPSPRPRSRLPDGSRPQNGRGGCGELVLRRTKHGDQMIRAGAGRWNAAAEAVFFAALERTACVVSAAAACGFSTNALYKRREAYPEFAAAWDAALDRGRARIPDLLAAATLASLDPGAPPQPKGKGRGRLPRVNVDQAIRISKMQAPPGGRRKPVDPREYQRREAERHAALTVRLRKLLAIVYARRRKAKLAEGWSEVDGLLIPPGWVDVGP